MRVSKNQQLRELTNKLKLNKLSETLNFIQEVQIPQPLVGLIS